MAKKKEYNITVIHTYASGRVVTDEEFMANPPVVTYENDKQVIDNLMMILAPEHIKRQKEIEKLRKNRERREQLVNELINLGG